MNLKVSLKISNLLSLSPSELYYFPYLMSHDSYMALTSSFVLFASKANESIRSVEKKRNMETKDLGKPIFVLSLVF